MNVFERTARRLDEAQQQHRPTAVLCGVVKKFGDDNAGVLVSNLAYSAFLALFPLLLILVTVLGVVLSDYPSADHAVLHSTFADFPIVGSQLGNNIHALRRGSALGLTIGLIGLLWGSIGLAQSGLFAMAQVWNLPGPDRPNYFKRLGRGITFLAVLGLGLILSTFLASFGTFGRHNVMLGLIAELLAVLVNTVQYLLAFRVLTPKVVTTSLLVPGAVVGGIAWTALLAVGGYLIGHDLRNDRRDLRPVRHRSGTSGLGLPWHRDQHLRGRAEHRAGGATLASAPWCNRRSRRPISTCWRCRPPRTGAGPNSRSR